MKRRRNGDETGTLTPSYDKGGNVMLTPTVDRKIDAYKTGVGEMTDKLPELVRANHEFTVMSQGATRVQQALESLRT